MSENQRHWDKIYSERQPTEVSWYEPMPEVSLDLIRNCGISKDAAILDVGGGDSFLAEFLVSLGYGNVSVLDISPKAIERAKKRMCEKADNVTWIVADVTDFDPDKQYDVWHDRGAFHFLTEEEQKKNYLSAVQKAVKSGGYVILATFSNRGPEKCSGLQVQRYSVGEMCRLFEEEFEMITGKNLNHQAPSGELQNFTFCSFKKNQ